MWILNRNVCLAIVTRLNLYLAHLIIGCAISIVSLKSSLTPANSHPSINQSWRHMVIGLYVHVKKQQR